MEILEDEDLLNTHGLDDSVDPTTVLCRGSIVINKREVGQFDESNFPFCMKFSGDSCLFSRF
jgi:hypothetical protein